MKVHVSIVIIMLLFSLGGLSAGGQTAQEKSAAPLPHATPAGGTSAERHVDQPVRISPTKGAETPSPAQPASQQQTSPVSPNLEESLAGLTAAVTKLVDKQAEAENVPISFLGLLTAVLVGITAVFTLCFTIIDIRKPSWYQNNRPLFILVIPIVGFIILLAFVLLGLLYLFSGLVTAVLYGFIAIVMLLIALLLAAAHLLTFIEEKYPELRHNILTYFPPNKSRSIDATVALSSVDLSSAESTLPRSGGD